MKTCIVTLYKTINSGSYWQARALGLVIEKMGHQVFYLERKYNTDYTVRRYLKILKMALAQGIKAAIRYANSLRGFKKCQKVFRVIPNEAKKFNPIDYFVLGSDTIWNLNSENLISNINIFWGGCFAGRKIITYAGSVSNTPYESFEKFHQLPYMVNSWDKISARDSNTYDVLSSMTDKKIEMVCDPTLLLNMDDYKTLTQEMHESKYIFLYLFAGLTDSQISELKEFAVASGLQIIHGTTHRNNKYCNKVITNTPDNFLRYMLNADYVITDTFHGSVFSVNFRKQFVAINRGKNKVSDFLKSTHFEERLINENDSIIPTLTKEVEFATRMKYISDLRDKSLKYLKSALESE